MHTATVNEFAFIVVLSRMFEIDPHCPYVHVQTDHLKECMYIFFLFFCISGAASFQQGFSRKEQPDHVLAEDVAASDSSDEPSLRPFQALQRQNSDEVRPEDEENAGGLCMPGKQRKHTN